MNCKTANKIDLILYLKGQGYNPVKTNNNSIWFLSPFREEKTASFKVDSNRNLWYDFGEGIGGTVIDFVMKYNTCSIKRALEIINSNNFYFHQQIRKKDIPKKPKYSILKVAELSHPNLINYLKNRKLNIEFAKRFLFQVHYSFDSKRESYGIGFVNNYGGFEIRNIGFKGCLGKKAITTINNTSEVVSLFESWSDFLSYLTLKKVIPNENFIILNSTSLIKNILELINDFIEVKCFFDNDEAGDKAFKVLNENFKAKMSDCRKYYKRYNDLNDFLIAKSDREC